ncbi:MAG: endonuclease/exonuclease/phosphatase family protein [Oscillospiraceae bacterium]|nr:endonuclease/exonuclease/phosphatase family protein [Oscillospiraceae bacterium]
MKLMTINTHSHAEENYSEKLKIFTAAIAEELPDIIAMQEVSQTVSSAAVNSTESRYFPCADVTVRSDNHVYNAVLQLAEKGISYYYTWLPIKLGYGSFDEGIALMSRSPVIETDIITVSGTDEYYNWKTRKILGIRTENAPDDFFYTVHYGWWNDDEEPFSAQWRNTLAHIAKNKRVWLMGDINNPAEIKDQGYDLINRSGFYDSYIYADKKDNGITAAKNIDGWKERAEGSEGMRIDMILCSELIKPKYSTVIFDGKKYPVISDHFGVMIEYEK